MNKIDLIIDALTAFYVMAHEQKIQVYMDQSRDAFAAARELQALKPVAWQNKELPMEFYEYEHLDPIWYSHYRPLYALDLEVTK
jgi:hypothetical protein